MRTICWFSAGAASALATKIALDLWPDAIVCRIKIDNEHKDNDRFANDCERWFGRHILSLSSNKYKDCWDVWQSKRMINSARGAPCTANLKIAVRRMYEHPFDRNIFGFHSGEISRLVRARENEPFQHVESPLIDLGIDKQMCYRALQNAGIKLPAMYHLGYRNNNCIGCCKGGAGYWNQIRVDFPRVFKRMARLERELGSTCINGKFLDELKPGDGIHRYEQIPPCDLICPS